MSGELFSARSTAASRPVSPKLFHQVSETRVSEVLRPSAQASGAAESGLVSTGSKAQPPRSAASAKVVVTASVLRRARGEFMTAVRGKFLSVYFFASGA